MIAKSQSPIVIKMQGSWGSADIFNDMAQEYVKRVNEMSGGRLRIDYLLAGAVVKPFEVMDAVSRGVLDGGHTVPVYWYGKSKVASLFGSGGSAGSFDDLLTSIESAPHNSDVIGSIEVSQRGPDPRVKRIASASDVVFRSVRIPLAIR